MGVWGGGGLDKTCKWGDGQYRVGVFIKKGGQDSSVSYTLFTVSFTLNPLWGQSYKTRKLLIVYGSSSSLDMSRKIFSIISMLFLK